MSEDDYIIQCSTISVNGFTMILISSDEDTQRYLSDLAICTSGARGGGEADLVKVAEKLKEASR